MMRFAKDTFLIAPVLLLLTLLASHSSPAQEATSLPAPYIHVPAIIDAPSTIDSTGRVITPGPTDVLGQGERVSIRPHPYLSNIFVEVVVRTWEVSPPFKHPSLRAYGPTFSYSVPVNPQSLPPWWQRSLGAPYNSGIYLAGPNSSNTNGQGPNSSMMIRRQSLTAADLSRNYITVPDVDGRPHLIRFEEGTRSELMERLRSNHTLADSLRTFPRVAGTFAVATVIVEMAACFGGNGFSDLAFDASPASPLCVERVLQLLLAPETYLGFFAFHILNGYTHKHLHNLFTATSLYVNKPLTPQVMTALRGPLRYGALGLSFAAVDLMSHIMRNPNMAECIKDMASGQFGSSLCQTVASDLASADHFWNDFSVSFATIMTAAIATGATMTALKDVANLATDAELRRGVWQLSSRGRLVGAVREIRRIRVLKDIVSVSSGPPGWIVLVATTAGEFAVFLAWNHLLEKPVSQTVWSWIDGPDIRHQTDRLLGVVQSVKEQRGFSQETLKTDCTHTYRAVPGTRRAEKVETCTTTDILADSLQTLRKHTQRFRQKIHLHEVNKSFPGYVGKWDHFISHYFAGKFVLQDIYRQRAENPPTDLHIIQLATVVYNAWNEYFQFISLAGLGDSSYNEDQLQLRNLIPQLQQAYLRVDNAYRKYTSDQTVDYATPENQLRELLLDIKKRSGEGTFADFDPTIACDVSTMSYYYLCRALKVMRMVPAQAQDFNLSTLNGHLLVNLLLPSLNSAGLDSIPLRETYLQYLCSEKKQFEITNVGLLGRIFGQEGYSQTLELPQIVVGLENDLLFTQSCESNMYLESSGQHQLLPEIVDISPNLRLSDGNAQYGLKGGGIWLTERLAFIDPMSLLTDNRIALSPGQTAQQAQQWWNQNAVPEILSYYTDFIVDFKTMLDERFLSLFHPQEPPAQLLEVQLGGNIDELLETDTVLDAKITNRSRLDLSLIGQMQTLIRGLQLLSPSLNDAPTDQNFQRASQKFLIDYAEHLRHFTYNADPAHLREEWRARIQKFLSQPQNENPGCFAYDIAQRLFGDSVQAKAQRHQQLLSSVESLRLAFTNSPTPPFEYSIIDTFKPEDVSRFTAEHYKNYIAMQILQEAYELISEAGIYYDTFLHNTGLYNLSPMVINCGQ